MLGMVKQIDSPVVRLQLRTCNAQRSLIPDVRCVSTSEVCSSDHEPVLRSLDGEAVLERLLVLR